MSDDIPNEKRGAGRPPLDRSDHLSPSEWAKKYKNPQPTVVKSELLRAHNEKMNLTKPPPDRPATVADGLVEEGTAVRVISRRMTSLALHTLGKICEFSKNDGARVSAAREILDRAWGRTHVIVEDEVNPGARIQVVFGNQPSVKVIDQEDEEQASSS